jgi:pyruvate dehydrogenase E2 component (dihydrolipoamide acetyltransferase)/2-oxoisovalerate dehydrogenase E2 component (dihydrolipoyl transacylase)
MDFRLPELGEGVYEAEMVGWLVKPGDTVKRGQSLMEVMTDKATMEVPSPFAGTVTGLIAQPGQPVKVGDIILSYTGSGIEAEATPAPAEVVTHKKATAAIAKAAPPEAMTAAPTGNGVTPRPAGAVKAAPSVRHLARKLGIDLTSVPGSGPGGRVLIEDLSKSLAALSGKKRRAEPAGDYGKPGSKIKLIGLRRKIADKMSQSKRSIPHYSYVDECEVTDLVRLRASLKDVLAASGIKLTYLAFIVKAAARALREVPIVNATLDEAAGEIVLHEECNIGIAVATPGGLIVPVIQGADKKDLYQIARDIDRLSAEARIGKSKLEDLKGGTFTVTSIGNIGGLISTPVINHPECGILGIGKIIKRPVYDSAGNLRPADLMYLSFSFDHRVLDGAIGAVFGNAVIRLLENPAALLLPKLN